MKVLVTGASGNVGTSVLRALAADPSVSEILGVARRLPSARFQKTTWHAADVSRDDLAPLLDGVDAVVHLAWLIQPSRDEARTREVNVAGSERVFRAVGEAGVPALVYASSVGAYGAAPQHRMVDESWPTSGISSSFYSRHKAAVERALDNFEASQPEVRTVRLRPALTFKGEAATGIRRLFIGPLLPGSALRPALIAVLPFPRGLRVQAVHSDDVAEAYRLAVTTQASGAFNIAAEPVLDGASIARMLGARLIEISAEVVRGAAWASWKLRLQPTPPGWLDMGMLSPTMSTARARGKLGWEPKRSSLEAVQELLDGLRRGAGVGTPPLDPKVSGPLRVRELATGVGAKDR